MDEINGFPAIGYQILIRLRRMTISRVGFHGVTAAVIFRITGAIPSLIL